MDFGLKLKQMRVEKGLTLDALAKQLNETFPGEMSFNKGLLSKWENGKTEPRLSSIRLLAQFYDVGLDELNPAAYPKPFKKTKHHTNWEAQITHDDELNVERQLEAMLAGDSVIAAYGGKLPSEMTEQEKEDYELYVAALRMVLLHAKRVNKQRHTPLKYRIIHDREE